MGPTAWAKRTRTHPRVLATLAAGELAALFAEMYERARSDLPDEDPDRDFEDRGLKLAVTFGGAGVLHAATCHDRRGAEAVYTFEAPRPCRPLSSAGHHGHECLT